jgi:hypothetical protein
MENRQNFRPAQTKTWPEVEQTESQLIIKMRFVMKQEGKNLHSQMLP